MPNNRLLDLNIVDGAKDVLDQDFGRTVVRRSVDRIVLDHHMVLAAQDGDAVIVWIADGHELVVDIVVTDGARTAR